MTEFLISKNSRLVALSVPISAENHKYFTFQQILEELQCSGWNIRTQEENEDLGAKDLKEMFIEADKERRDSTDLVIPKRVIVNKENNSIKFLLILNSFGS